MYESEINPVVELGKEIPQEVLSRFAETRRTVVGRTLIPWSEHCTECVWPTCYQTCDLYESRTDGRCRRFRDGMVRIDCKAALNSYLLKISFKRWAKLWAPARLTVHSLHLADRAERRDLRFASYIHSIPWPPLQRTVATKRYSLKKRQAILETSNPDAPNCFLIECYNPNAQTVAITLSVRTDPNPIQFQKLFLMRPGFNREYVALGEIQRKVDLTSNFQIDLTPNEIADGLTLYFGAIDFVVDRTFTANDAPSPEGAASSCSKPGVCKCVVWDSDNTLWEGILIEDGPENIHLKPGIPKILKELDERGILISAVSKNEHDDAMSALRRFQMDEYFLFPQISWNPKSQGIQQIARELNIGIDSLMLIDDSPFEIAQVRAACPDVMVLDAAHYTNILAQPECQSPVRRKARIVGASTASSMSVSSCKEISAVTISHFCAIAICG